MDINELNKMSVTALFSKLTSQFNFGSGKGFAGLLSGTGSDGMFPSADNAVSQSKPVENKVSKPRTVDVSEDKTQDVSSANKGEDKVKNKKTAKTESEKPVSDKKASGAVDKSQDAGKSEELLPEEDSVVTQVAVPVAEVLIPTAEAGEVNSFEIAVAANGIMADGAALEGVDTAGGEAEVLPAGVVTLSAEKNTVSNFEEISLAPEQTPFLRENEALPENAGENAPVSIVDGLVKTGETENTVDGDIQGFVSKAQNTDNTALNVAPVEENVVAAENVAVKGKTTGGEEKAQGKIEFVSEKDGNVQEDGLSVEVKAAGHRMAEAPVANVQVEKAEIPADKLVEDQAAQLEEMLDGKQLKVSVDVKEEKIAYHTNQSLIKDRLAVDEAVAGLENVEDNMLSAGTDEKGITPAQSTVQANAPVQAAVAPHQSAAVVEEGAANNVAEVSKIGGVSGNTAHAAGAGSAEYANLAKNEANARTNETSFRDVFKGMAKEAVEQVKVNITKSAVKGVDSINVHLKPEELGRIEVKMQIKDGKLHAQIISSRPETMEALQREAQVLEKAFNEAGFQTDENSLNFSCRNDGQQAGQNQGGENPLRSFIGEVFETEANGELLSAEAANQNWSAEKGLNIKV